MKMHSQLRVSLKSCKPCLNSHSVRGCGVFKISNGMKKKIEVEIYTEKISVFLKERLEDLSTEL